MQPRIDQRRAFDLRPVEFTLGFQRGPQGSVLIRCGGTRVLCAVTAVPGVPRWMKEQGKTGGWLTAEYAMLPGANPGRSARETGRSGPSGRSQEIQRLVGRSLRAAVDLTKLGDHTLYVDCDVIDADGGTRCASITGASVALELALRHLQAAGKLAEWPLRTPVAAVSVGMIEGEPVLDLCYTEDSAADVDMNVVMTAEGKFIEVQGTAEGEPFAGEALDAMLTLARRGLDSLFQLQRQVLSNA